MKKYIPALVLISALPILAFAQDVPPVDPNADFLQLLLSSLGGIKGMSTLGIVGLAVQLLIKLANTTWIKIDGHIKLLIVSALGIGGGMVSLMMPPTNMTVMAALVHSTTLTAFMVFFNQIYQQWFAPKQP